MEYLIDTNVLSEWRKGARANACLATWMSHVPQMHLFLSVLVIGEVRCGIKGIRPRDATQAAALEGRLARICQTFEGRILPVTRPIAETWGRLSDVDGLLAATAITHDLTLVTRNTRDVARTGVRLLNPFEPQANP